MKILAIIFLLWFSTGLAGQGDSTVYYDSLGVVYQYDDKMSEAILAFSKAREIALENQNWETYAQTALQQGWCYIAIEAYDSTEWMLNEVLDNLNTRLDGDIEKANIYHCLSAVSSIKNRNSLAVEYAQKAVDIALKKEESKKDLAIYYDALSVAYMNKFDFHKSLESQFLSLELNKEIKGERSNEVANSYNNIGIVYHKLGNLDKALEFHENSLSIKIEKSITDDPSIATTYNDMAIIYKDLGDLDKSIELLLKSLELERNIYGEKSYEIVDKYGILTTVYKKKGMHDEALSYNEKGLEIWRSTFSENLDLYVRTVRSTADIYANMGEYVTAYGYYYKSLSKILGQFGSGEKIPIPDKSSLIENMDVLFSLANYGEAVLSDQYNRGDEEQLQKALQLFNLSSSMVDMIRTGNKEKFSRLDLQDIAAVVYEGGITAAYELYQITEDENYLDQAFTFSEKNKYTVLHSFIVENKALELSNIPADDPRQENHIPMNDIEDLVLEEDLGLIEFFWGENWVYTFSISPYRKSIYRQERTEALSLKIHQFRSVISNSDVAFTKQKDESAYDELVAQSRQLYTTFLEPAINTEVTSIIIIPDGPLYYMPFEMLLTDDKKLNIRDYSALPYLIRKYPVRYGYSSQLLLSNKISKDASKRLAAFAPLYEDQYHGLSSLNSQMSTLQHAQEEARIITDKFGGTLYGGKDITREVFKTNASDYNILHLAMHAFTDDNNPMYSGMIFSQKELMHTYELYNMELNADLVVLSACSTGIDKIIKGEGIMSLVRAFRHAGASNIVMSHWSADDETTSDIMTLFYDHLASGLPKHKALSQAKLDYLDSNSRKVHPYFWSSFVLVGDDEPLFLSRSFSLKDYLLLGVIGFLFIAIGVSLYKYMR